MSDSVRPHRRQPPRLPRPWILQARTMEWVAISFSNAWKWSEVAQSCLTLSDAMDCSLPGSSVHGIFQARVLEWGAISLGHWSSFVCREANDCELFLVLKVQNSNTQDGRGIGQGDHFIPYKFIKRTFKRRVNSTKQLLNAGRGHQEPRKAAHCLQKEVGKK